MGESIAVQGESAGRELRLARLAVAYIFFANGALMGNWVVRIPALMDKLGLGVGSLAFAFFAAPVGSIVAMPLASRVITRFGSRRTTRVAFFAFCASILPISFVPDLYLLGTLIFFIGSVASFTDVAMNTNALALERRYGRPILSSFHAWFSAGGLAGSGTGALAAWAALDIRIHLPLSTAATALGAAVLVRYLLEGVGEAEQEKRSFFVKPPRQLVALGFLALASLLSEDAIGTWSAAYINKSLLASQGVAALGYFAFSLLMVTGRLSGDRLTTKMGPIALTRAGGLLAFASLTAALLIGHPIAAIIGFAGMGAGLAVVVPTVFRAAGSHPDIPPAVGLASVSMIGYFGFFIGPPLIGGTGHLIGLPKALGFVALFMAAIFLLAAHTAPGERHTGEISGAPASTD